MIKDLNVRLLSIDGDELIFESSPITMRKIIIDVLLDSALDDHTISGEEKLNRYLLAVKCKKMDKIDLSPEQIVLLKKLVGKKHPPLIVGQFYQYIDDTISINIPTYVDI